MPTGVQIQGDGVAARTAAYLLSQAGIGVRQEAGARPPLPTILLSGSTRQLMRDLFADPRMLEGLPAIRKREVAWGRPSAGPLDHWAYSTSEVELLAALGQPAATARELDFTLYTERPLPAGSAEHRFGERQATLARMVRRPGEPVCQMEATSAGWLFSIPTAGCDGWLIAVGAPLDRQLAESSLIAPVIEHWSATPGSFPTAPRLAWPLTGEGWVACGSAAAGFDPICGEGTSYALREAILAAAVIQEGASAGARAHYESRLLAAFAKHLTQSRSYYESGPGTAWWSAQVLELDRGLVWCRERLAEQGPARFRLVDTRLEPVGMP